MTSSGLALAATGSRQATGHEGFRVEVEDRLSVPRVFWEVCDGGVARNVPSRDLDCAAEEPGVGLRTANEAQGDDLVTLLQVAYGNISERVVAQHHVLPCLDADSFRVAGSCA